MSPMSPRYITVWYTLVLITVLSNFVHLIYKKHSRPVLVCLPNELLITVHYEEYLFFKYCTGQRKGDLIRQVAF